MHWFKGLGFRIHYVEQGSGEPVVFAHGYVMDHTMFAPQFEELPHAYRCVAWDLRGHGRSQCPPGPWTMQDLVDDLAAFIEGVHAAPCHLVGMSTGGMQAVRLALQRPDLVRSLVLIDTSADAEDPDRADRYLAFQAQLAEHGATEELVRLSLPVFYGAGYMAAEPEAMAIHVARAMDMPQEALIEGIRVLVERDSVAGRLGEIGVPTLVIHGEEDAAIPVEKAEQLAAGIPGAELVRVPGAGHTTPMEAADLVNQALEEFLGRRGPATVQPA